MITTSISLMHIPEPHATKLRHKTLNPMSPISYSNATELIAWIEGKEVDTVLVNILLEVITLPTYFSSPPIIPSSTIQVKGRDGKTLSASRATLCRRFHFFDDFFTEFPDATEVEVPFDHKDILFVLKGEKEGGTFLRLARSIISLFRDEEEKLIDHFDCLSYFNPKSALEYFSLSTIGMSSERLVDLHSLLTDKEKKEILDTHYNTRGPSLPNRGLGLDVLALILVSHHDAESLLTLFSSYPSFLCVVFCEMSETDLVDNLLLTAAFTDTQNIGPECDTRARRVVERVFILLSRVDKWEEVSRLLTMLCICCREYGNKDDYVPFVYRVNVNYTTDDSTREYQMKDRVAKNIARLCPHEISKKTAYYPLLADYWRGPFMKM